MSKRPQAHGGLAAATLFRSMWEDLVDLVGTPATAALLRRALKRASARAPGAALPRIEQAGLEYRYTVPESWQDASRQDAVEELRRLVRDELEPLFWELTGPVIVRRLAQIPEWVDAGFLDEEEIP